MQISKKNYNFLFLSSHHFRKNLVLVCENFHNFQETSIGCTQVLYEGLHQNFPVHLVFVMLPLANDIAFHIF